MNTIPPKWQKIDNIFTDFPGYNCFGCSPFHDHGLNLEFYYDPEEVAVVSPISYIKEEFAGFPGILHGGFQGLMLDEIMFWAVYRIYNKLTVTASMNIRFKKPVSTLEPMLLKAKVRESRKNKIFKVEGWLEKGTEILSSGQGVFVVPPRDSFQQAFGENPMPEKFSVLF
jgi:acyl-coenzyme A thioesterase PaaI-like protein